MNPRGRDVLALVAAGMIVFCAVIGPLTRLNLRIGTRFAPTAVYVTIGALCLGALVVDTRRRSDARSTPSSLQRLAWLAPRVGVVLVVWVLVSALLSDRPAVSLTGLYVDGTGALFTCGLVGAWALGRASGRRTRWISDALIAVVLANTAIALLQAVGLHPLGIAPGQGRADGFLANPIFMSQLLVGGWWLVAQRYGQTRRWEWAAAVTAIAAAIQAGGSRSIIVLMALAAVSSLLFFGWRVGVILCLATGLGVVALTIGPISSLGVAKQGNTGTSRLANESDFGARLDTWHGGLRAVAAHPVFGAGPGRFRAATERYKTLRGARIDGPEALYTDAHDLAVHYLVTIGIGGFAVLGTFLALSLLLAGWREPLAGFSLLVLAAHAVEPQTAFVTPLAFVALGVAGARGDGVRVPLKGMAATAALGLSCWLVLAVGSWNLTRPGATPATTMAKLRTARTLLYPWREPYTISGLAAQRLPELGPDHSAEALRLLRAAAQREPDDPDVWYSLAAQQKLMGLLTDARASLEKGLALNPQTVAFRVALADLESGQGDPASARTLYEQALAIDPSSSVALAGLSRLKP